MLLAGSAIGWYGDTGGKAVDESAPNGTGFLATLVRDWEEATAPASAAGIRVVNLRSGIVLSSRGGMLGPLLLPFRLGLGAKIGAGTQYLSWITLTDHIRAVQFLLAHQDLDGPVNLTAPAPATNADFTRALARAVHRPAVLQVPAGLVRLALGELSTELLAAPGRACPARGGRLHLPASDDRPGRSRGGRELAGSDASSADACGSESTCGARRVRPSARRPAVAPPARPAGR